MVVIHRGRVGIKPTGGIYHSNRDKRKFESGSRPSLTGITGSKVEAVRGKGGNYKVKVYATEVVNVLNPKTKKFSKAKIKTVKENPGNRHFVRQNVVTRGAILDTEVGLVKVTSRPGQDGTVNGILIS